MHYAVAWLGSARPLKTDRLGPALVPATAPCCTLIVVLEGREGHAEASPHACTLACMTAAWGAGVGGVVQVGIVGDVGLRDGAGNHLARRTQGCQSSVHVRVGRGERVYAHPLPPIAPLEHQTARGR